jgi:hypothetical protein
MVMMKINAARRSNGFFELRRVGGGVWMHHFVAKFEYTPDR